MTKKQFKIYLKFGTLLFGIALLIIACTKDEEYFMDKTVVSETNPIGTINPSDINKNVIDWNEFMLRTSLDASSDIFQSFDISSSRNLSEFVIATESDNDNEVLIVNEIEMINYNGVTTYTFVVLENNDGHSFRNLILRTENNIDFEAFIALYNPTEDWLNSNQDITPFQGQVQINPYTGNYQIVTQSGTTTTCTFSIDVVWECDAGNNHPPGHPRCNVGGAEVVAINITETCHTTSVGGSNPDNGIPWQGENNDSSNYNNGGLNNNPNDNENTTDNGNNLPLDGLLTKPNKSPLTDPHVDDLLKISSIPKVKTELNRLKNNMGFTTQEDGKRFIYTGNDINNTDTYTDSNFNQQEPESSKSNVLFFPPLENKTLIGAHYHPPLDDSSPPKPIRKVPSGTDIAEHIVMVKKVAETDPTIPTHTNQVTNFVVSKGASGKTYAIRTNNEQDTVNLDGDFEIDGKKREEIAKAIAELILPIPVSDISSQEQAISAYLTLNYPSISIYVATYNSAGEITTWTKL